LYYIASVFITLCTWPSGAQVERGHVEAYNKLFIKQEFVH